MAWQFAFFVVGSDPERFRLMMMPCILEKATYVVSIAILFMNGRIAAVDALSAVPDTLLGVLFIVAFVKVSTSEAARGSIGVAA